MMSKWAAFMCCAMLAAPAPAQVTKGSTLTEKEKAALAKKQKDEAEKRAFMARVTRCDGQAKNRGLNGESHRNFMRDCMKQ